MASKSIVLLFSVVILVTVASAFEDSLFRRTCKSNKKCDKAAGTCVSSESDCETGDTVSGKCSGSCVCCLDGGKCEGKSKRKCDKNGGTCKPTCRVGEKEIRDGCSGNKCKCCRKGCDLSKCKSAPTCDALGGTCVCKKSDCPSRKLDRNACKGVGCLCCLNEDESTPGEEESTPGEEDSTTGAEDSTTADTTSSGSEDSTDSTPTGL